MLYDKRWELETPPFAPLEPWRQVLLDAADVLERHGWCQGRYHQNGKHCAIGAIVVAAGGEAAPWPGGQANGMLRRAVGPVGQWNDHPDRTVAEVVAKMREVARSG